ncbi:MAG: family acetyltransferase [Phenylobacterium sp.]|nr:family acetyltransferase [Phenylobacterium sp.]
MTDPQAIRIRQARREDVDAIVALLAGDDLGAGREVVSDPPAPAYLQAFGKIAADPRNLLAAAEDASGRIVGTLQLTFIPGLSNQGAELALLQAVRITAELRGQGLGRRLVAWAMGEARRRGCQAMELLSHNSRVDAQRFYERLGFVKSHVGMRRAL